MKTFRLSSVVRLSVVAVLVAFVITPNAANAETESGITKLLKACKPAPTNDGQGHKCWRTQCNKWDYYKKCCTYWGCQIIH